MSDNDAINISGLAETQRELYAFSAALGDKVTVLALRAGANFMLKKIREAEPQKTGRLKRATVTKNSRINRRRVNGKVGVYVVVKAGKRSDPKSALYGQFIERGYKRKDTVVAGKHFVTSTFAAYKGEALSTILTAIDEGGQRLVQNIRNL